MAPIATPKFCGGRSSGQFFVVSKVKMPMHEDLHEGWFHNTHRPAASQLAATKKKNTKHKFCEVQTLGFVCFFSPRGVWRSGSGVLFFEKLHVFAYLLKTMSGNQNPVLPRIKYLWTWLQGPRTFFLYKQD